MLGRAIQVVCLTSLVILAWPVAHFYFRLDILTLRSLLFRVRMFSFNQLLLSFCQCILIVGAVITIY